MVYLDFKKQFFELGCFSIHQVYAWQPNFDRNNITRWIKKGYLIRLRQGYYTFPELIKNADNLHFLANRIYLPSYLSLYTALSYYGIIPESVVQITSVTTLKTYNCENEAGQFSYNSIKKNLYNGFQFKEINNNKTILFASPEKALFDLLYLFSFYNSAKEIEGLRLDEEFLHSKFSYSVFLDFVGLSKSKVLEKRAKLLSKVYSL